MLKMLFSFWTINEYESALKNSKPCPIFATFLLNYVQLICPDSAAFLALLLSVSTDNSPEEASNQGR